MWKSFWKSVWKNSMLGSSECDSMSIYCRRLAVTQDSTVVCCGRVREESQAWIEHMMMAYSLKVTDYTMRSVLFCQIPVPSKVLLIFFSPSAFSLSNLNSTRKSSGLMFVFLTCCQSSSSWQYVWTTGSKILTYKGYILSWLKSFWHHK